MKGYALSTRRRWCGIWLIAIVFAFGCERSRANTTGTTDAGFETLRLRYQGWASIVTTPELAEDLGYLDPLRLEWVGNTISGPQDIQTVVTGDIEFGTAFNGAIVKLVATRAPITSVIASGGVDEVSWGGYYVLQESPIRNARDLIGKKVAMNTLGAHTEFILREYLARNGLPRQEANQVTMVVVPPTSGELTLREKHVDVAVLSGVAGDKARERGGIRLLFSDYELTERLVRQVLCLATLSFESIPMRSISR